jgi:TonB-linked SusC/RagA family outer membrane protein
MKKKQHFADLQWSGVKKLLLVMKLTAYLLFFSVIAMASGTYGQETRFDLNVKDANVIQVFDEIERITEFGFLFKTDQLDLNQHFTLDIKRASIEQILNEVLDKDQYKYTVIDRNIVITKLGANAFQDDKSKTIIGKVTDSSGASLPGVSVVVKGTTTGIITDSEGNYSLSNIPENSTLQFSFVGMKSKEVLVGNQTSINIRMDEVTINLDEVVAVGYGTQKKSDLTGAVYSVKSESWKDKPNANILKSLQGIVPGLVITNTLSAPGSSPEIRIRGEKSLSASNNPLIILDGIPFEGNLNDISANDMESASVLKDASSAAIYGARASNGVIIITTKKGVKGKARVNYSGYYGVQTAEKKLDMMDGAQYFQLKVDIAKNQGNVTDFSPQAILNSAELPQYLAGTTTDWQNMVLRTGSMQEHNVSVSGGSDKTNYYTSLNFLNQNGIMEYSGMKRVTIRSNVDFEINDWLKTGVNLQLTNKDLGGFIYSTKADFNGKLPDFADALRLSPYGKVYDQNGHYSQYPEFPNTFYNFSNPFGNDGSTAYNVTRRAIVNLFGEISFPFLKGLTYRLNYGVDYANQEVDYYWPSYTYYGLAFKGNAETNNNNQLRSTWENILKYTKDFNGHHIDFTGLFSRESYAGKTYRQVGKGFVNDDNLYNFIESAESKEIYSTLTETDLVSYMARFNYNFKNRYFLTATGRKDGYSGFGENNKYGFFPSAALGWIPTEEGFMQNSESLKFVDYLKIRTSLGENGNMGISPYQTLDALKTASYVFGNNPTTANALLLKTVGNPDLKWESTVTFNVGLDFAVLKNRISGSLDYYRSHSKDLLMTRNVPVMNGYTSIWYNIGKTENKGFEFNLNTKNVEGKKFGWTTNLNFSLSRDKIVELRGDGKDDLANNWFIGKPLRVYFDYNLTGIWQTGENIAGSAQPSAKPGYPKFQDVVEDKKIDAKDRIIMGSKLPSWVGGMTNTFSYGNWSLAVYVNTVQGIIKADNIEGTYIDVPYWREDRPSNKFAARGIIQPTPYGTYRDASYVRINNASLSYNVPKKTLDRLGISNLRLYLSGQNLYTFTHWLGYDPEAQNTDITYFDGPYPDSRTITLGLNLGF